MLSIRTFQIALVLSSITALLWLANFRASFDPTFANSNSRVNTATSDSLRIDTPEAKQVGPLRRRRVAVGTVFPHHEEVYGAFAWTIANVLDSEKHVGPNSVHIYAEQTDFISLMKQLGQLPESMFRPAGKEELIAAVRSTTLFPDDPGAMIDLVALATCEIDLPQLGPDLLQAWDARPADKKFMLVCGAHNGADPSWQQKHSVEWAKRGAFRLLVISDHVVKFFKTQLDQWADSKDPVERLSFYEYVKVNAFYPVSDFVNFPLPDKSGGSRVPCTGLLQGGFETYRRDYNRIFLDLIRLLREDPRAWGYQWSDAERMYLPDSDAPNPPFVLHLLGWSRERLDIPQELERVVVKDVDFNMRDFYTLVQSMDIVIPGFSIQGGYLTQQASSTVHTALENRIPILATRTMLEAYPHIAGIASIFRPASLSEMEAIGLLRGAKINSENPDVDFSEVGSPASTGSQKCVGPLEFCQDVRAMLEHGWRRNRTEWDRHLQDVWKKNERLIGEILRDL
ncbi:hypothetical protein FRC04_002511 [Tulasnella sp. 424]|nr:hypothetical protein FRC04_002511 [Tulasnella sp. 424]KAG8967091.1 hypothetical protein FRC05_002305 [Tulasnella sp. 425]